MTETVILVHGYFRTFRDMHYLEGYLKKQGYRALSPMIPTTLGSLEECSDKLSGYTDTMDLSIGDRLHFVGHSIGGLIIRHCLASRMISYLGRCVLIATPNAGTSLADLTSKLLRYSPMNPFKSIRSLQTSAENIRDPLNSPLPEIGVISGNNSNLSLGILLRSQNDGRVEVDSTKFGEMKDFVILPYGHHEIHHREETAKLVDVFLKTGSFRLDQDSEHLDSSS